MTNLNKKRGQQLGVNNLISGSQNFTFAAIGDKLVWLDFELRSIFHFDIEP